MGLVGGTAMGCRVVLLAVRATVVSLMEAVVMRGWAVAGRAWTITAGGSSPTEMNRDTTSLIQKCIKNNC